MLDICVSEQKITMSSHFELQSRTELRWLQPVPYHQCQWPGAGVGQCACAGLSTVVSGPEVVAPVLLYNKQRGWEREGLEFFMDCQRQHYHHHHHLPTSDYRKSPGSYLQEAKLIIDLHTKNFSKLILSFDFSIQKDRHHLNRKLMHWCVPYD